MSYFIPLLIAVAAVVFDLRRREIPDTLSLSAAISGFVAAAFNWNSVSFRDAFVSMLLVFLVVCMFAWRGGFGGGDVKLMTGLASWLLPMSAIAFLFWTAIVGMLLSFVAVIRQQRDLAYGPAIAVGFLITGYQPQLLPQLVGLIRSAIGIQ